MAAITPKEAADEIITPTIPGNPISASKPSPPLFQTSRSDVVSPSNTPIISVATPRKRDTKPKVMNGTGKCPTGFVAWDIDVGTELADFQDCWKRLELLAEILEIMRILSALLVLLAGTSSATAFEGIPYNHSGFASGLDVSL